MITSAQIRLVQTARRALRIGEDDYRALLRAEAGVDSSKDLDNAGFDRVLRRLEKMGFSHTHRANPPRSHRHQPAALITPEQQQLIVGLYAQLGWTDQARQMGFAKRCCRKAFPQTRTDANKVIEGLKAIAKRLETKEAQHG